ncbi:hypothetical protein KP509_19G059000 [Ceratopteris richardii]|nr:hypothetical protein KP509_19G059000 [Ceratopteris richardii]KAH7352699.1 hypothetical protein KP509_19G059000 [Ceratopteris richardii]
MGSTREQEEGSSQTSESCCNNTGGDLPSQANFDTIFDDVGAVVAEAEGAREYNREPSVLMEDFDIQKVGGLQNLLQIAEEVETEEYAERKEVSGIHKEDKTAPSCPKEMKSTASPSERDASTTSPTVEGKSHPSAVPSSLESQRVICSQSTASARRKSSRSGSSAPITVGSSRSQFTISQPFSLATDKRAFDGRRAKGAECVPSHKEKAFGRNGTLHEANLRTPEIHRLPAVKATRSETFRCRESEILDNRDDDAVSIYSTQSCLVAPKAKTSWFTSTSSFKFQTDARAEKRKEYYAKLQERMIVKEDEKNRMQEKVKKEREEEIKQLRRSLNFKANPIPRFYQEGPPKMPELQKVPTTRARSPKFSRRESSGGSTRLCSIIKCEANTSSLSPYESGKCQNGQLHSRNDHYRRGVEGRSSASPNERDLKKEGSMLSPRIASKLSTIGNSSLDVHVKGQGCLIVSSELMMGNDDSRDLLVQSIKNECALDHGIRDDLCHDYGASINSNEVVAGLDLHAQPDCWVNTSNTLQSHPNTYSSVSSFSSNKVKAVAWESSNHLCTDNGNQSTRKSAA